MKWKDVIILKYCMKMKAIRVNATENMRLEVHDTS